MLFRSNAYGIDDYDLDKVIGKKVFLFHDPNVFMSGKKSGGIRVDEDKTRALAKGEVEADPDDDVPF